ncbi:PREDICTED: testis-specific H1 histone-like [Elephantulus edwardii]|uniref:testis-specific H1 histone-like n=1 Tax=Elephantulus edwardii TaxID=28737 RepID=UPI0003F0BAF8|nr:PREDICTED: testis-specific H1 histone-like [Elephantulus edwardii]
MTVCRSTEKIADFRKRLSSGLNLSLVRFCDVALVHWARFYLDQAPRGEAQSQWPRRGGGGAMVMEAGPAQSRGVPLGAQVKIQWPAWKMLRILRKRRACSVLKVTQLLLWAMATHKKLTLATLKKELGNAGYQVRKDSGLHSGQNSRPGAKGTLLRVFNGSNAAGHFRVCKVPKSKRKPRRKKWKEGFYSQRKRKTMPVPRKRWRRLMCLKTAKRAKEIRRQTTKIDSQMKKQKSKTQDLLHPRAKKKARSKMTEKQRLWTRKEKRRPEAKFEDKRRENSKKTTEQAIWKSALVKTNHISNRKTQDKSAPRTKTSTKSENVKTTPGDP